MNASKYFRLSNSDKSSNEVKLTSYQTFTKRFLFNK